MIDYPTRETPFRIHDVTFLAENTNITYDGFALDTNTSATDHVKSLTFPAKGRLSPDRLVYNRVPKCGSMTAVGIIKVLSTRNNFTVISSKIYDRAELETEEEQVGQALRSWSFF